MVGYSKRLRWFHVDQDREPWKNLGEDIANKRGQDPMSVMKR